MSSGKNRIIVIGLDGATLDLIHPYIREGYLPAFKKMVEEGIWGELASTVPPMTGPAWSSFITGKNPGKHGVFDFMMRNPEGYDWITINSTYRAGQAFWNLLGDQDRKVVVFNVPITYPPEKVNGVMVSGLLTPPGAKNFIIPPELKERMDNEVGPFTPHYPAGIYALGRENKFIREIELVTEGELKAIDFLMQKEPWDLFVGVIRSPDLLQHFLWHFEDKGHPFYRENPDVEGIFIRNYKRINDYLGGILKILDNHTTLFVVSDHGFGPIEKQFFINNWLLNEGFIVLKKTAQTVLKRGLYRMGLVPMRIHKLLSSLRVDLSKPLTQNRGRIFTRLSRWIILTLQDVDWRASVAYGMGNMGFINVNLKGREPQGIVEPGKDYERVLDRISERLFALKDPRSRTSLVDQVLRGREIYKGPQVSKAPDLYVVMKNYTCHARGDYVFNTNRPLENLWLFSGNHRPNGILLGKGPGLKQGYHTLGANIMDIAPTVLGLMNGLIPEDMDGRFLEDLLTDDKRSETKLNYVSCYAETSEKASLMEAEQEAVRRELRSLGYLA
jgi:predicted AlkP superfamily phosphohydrolase/phosphomutase